MGRYAQSTTVTSEKSRAEIERTLVRYSADAFSYGWETERAVIQFRKDGKHIRFSLPLPDKNDRQFMFTPARRQRRTQAAREEAYEQAVRQRWRALALAIKAKLESIESGIATFEQEFLAYIVLPNGSTVGENALPVIEQAYLTGEMPDLIPPSRQLN